MAVNLLNMLFLSNPVNTSYNGTYLDCDFINGNNNCRETKSNDFLLDMKKEVMEDRKHIEGIKSLLNSKLNDIDALSRSIGVPTDEMLNFLTEFASKQMASTSDCNIEDRIEGDKIVFESGGNLTKNYTDKSTKNRIKVLEIEISECHKRIKDKDEIIVSLRETIEVLKNK